MNGSTENKYDRSIRCLDEPHTPQLLEKISREGGLNKGKLLTEAHRDSYFQQMFHIRRLGVHTVLEIGPGEGVVAAYMRSLGVQYEIMDIVNTSEPRILGRIEDLDPLPYQGCWEIVCAFQVLEHSPYDNFVSNLKKMAEMSSRYVFLSLPFSCVGFSFTLKIALGQSFQYKKRLGLYIPLFKKNREYRLEFKKEFPWAIHYWEIGRRGFSMAKIRGDLRIAGLSILQEFRSENPYHYFILAEKENLPCCL